MNDQKLSPYRVRVLTVIDSPADERILHELWGKDAELFVTTLHTGIAGLAHLMTNRAFIPNLVVLGARFPELEMTTVQILAALKADKQLRAIPAVVLTASSDNVMIGDLYESGASCVIATPVDLDSFTDTMAKIKSFWLGVARLPRLTIGTYNSD